MGKSAQTNAPLRLAIAGLGTVGTGAINIIRNQHAMLEARTGRAIQIVAASARNINKKRDCELDGIELTTDALSLATRDDVDVIIELIGGEEGVAKALVETALKNGKHVVTANKALIAHHGLALAKLAEENQVQLLFEAAVTASIPILSALQTGYAANQVHGLSGILNGVCNYVLSQMYHRQLDMDVVMQEAQENGWLETDPSLDVDGIDAAHKLAILSSLAFGVALNFDGIAKEGIRAISLRDVRYADQFGYRIKLIARSSYSDAGGLCQAVYPALVPKAMPLAVIEDAYNAVMLETDAAGSCMIEGLGAGALPTGSAVVADIVSILRGDQRHSFGVPVQSLKAAKTNDVSAQQSAFYLRLNLVDKPGTLAEVTHVLGEHHISVRAIDQHELNDDGTAQVVVLTHETTVKSARAAFSAIADLPYCKDAPVMLRML